MLKTSLLSDELREKVYVTLSFLLSIRLLKPWRIGFKIEVSDGIYVGAEQSFENELPHVLYSVTISTECTHIKNGDWRAALNDLSEKTDHLHPVFFTQ